MERAPATEGDVAPGPGADGDRSGPVPTTARHRARLGLRRALAAVGLVVVGALAGSTAALASHSFTDVPTSHPFHDDISWMADNGIANGYGDGTYRPANPITRQAAAAMFRRLAGADPGVDPVVLADGIEVASASGGNNTITATTSGSAQTVATLQVDPSATYLLIAHAELYTTHSEASISCNPGGTAVEMFGPMYADLELGATYRLPMTSVSMVTEGNGTITLRCWKYGTFGSGTASVNAVSLYAIKVAG